MARPSPRARRTAWGCASRFNGATAIIVGQDGTLYIIDGLTIRKGVPLPNPGRLVNASVLTSLADAGDSLTIGASVGGPRTTGSKSLVVRAAGPALAPFGVTGALVDPRCEFYAAGTKVGENDDWGGAPNLVSAFAAVGAFPFAAAGSKDAALVPPPTPSGTYTLRIAGNGPAGGMVLGELYDADVPARTTSPRLVNISAMKNAGGAGGLTAGFIIGGTSSTTLLIRAAGPSLAKFGVAGCLADPALEVFDAKGDSIATNGNWGEDGPQAAADLSAMALRVGAFEFSDSASKDAAVLLTLAPGNYTVQVRSADGSSGVALVEVYELR